MVPVDLSAGAERALEYAVLVAESFDAELVLMMNVDLQEREALEEYATAQNLTLAEAAEERLRKLGATYGPNLSIQPVARFHTSAADGILHAAADAGVDAIVMGSHGRSGVSRWMIGSIAEKVVRAANVPVTVVPVQDS